MSYVQRTVYAASGPGRQEDVTPAGALAMAFEHCHEARVNLAVQYDQISGPEVVEPGVRVEFAEYPATGDKRPLLIQFDADIFTPDAARSWLGVRGIRDYVWQPDSRGKVGEQGSPREEPEKPPAGGEFDSLATFYARTIPCGE